MSGALWNVDHLDKYGPDHMLEDKIAPHAKHHPGPHFNRLRAEIVAGSLLELMIQAIG